MHWDLWIEPANSYEELKENLTKRGHRQLPLASSPLIDTSHKVNTNGLYQKKTMIRKKG